LHHSLGNTATYGALFSQIVSRVNSSIHVKDSGGSGRGSSRGQLKTGKIDTTCPHYVRCLKPNDLLIPDHFDPVIIADQLRCAGVIEAVRVSRVGYPQWYSHANFVKRYKTKALKEFKQISKSSRGRLKPCDALVYAIAKRLQEMDPSLKSGSGKDTCDVDLLEVGLQIGKTKVFLRSHAYELIEQLRHESMDKAAIKIQAAGRRRLHRNEFRSLRECSLLMQCALRKIIAERVVSQLRRNHNSTKIQSSTRMTVCR
jgi:myosin-5